MDEPARPRGRESWPTEALIRSALSVKSQGAYWGTVRVLHWRGTKEVFDIASDLVESRDPKRRRLGVDILAQLGIPKRLFPEKQRRMLHRLLDRERNLDVLQSILFAIGHVQEFDDPRGFRAVVRYRRHPSANIRYAVAWALFGHDDPLSIRTKIELSSDRDGEVRDWATSGLGSIRADDADIRAALRARLHDRNRHARGEALVGLAQRKDPAVHEPLAAELARDNFGSLALEAAAELGDPAFLPALRRHVPRPEEVDEINPSWLRALEDAITTLEKIAEEPPPRPKRRRS